MQSNELAGKIQWHTMNFSWGAVVEYSGYAETKYECLMAPGDGGGSSLGRATVVL